MNYSAIMKFICNISILSEKTLMSTLFSLINPLSPIKTFPMQCIKKRFPDKRETARGKAPDA